MYSTIRKEIDPFGSILTPIIYTRINLQARPNRIIGFDALTPKKQKL